MTKFTYRAEKSFYIKANIFDRELGQGNSDQQLKIASMQ